MATKDMEIRATETKATKAMVIRTIISKATSRGHLRRMTAIKIDCLCNSNWLIVVLPEVVKALWVEYRVLFGCWARCLGVF